MTDFDKIIRERVSAALDKYVESMLADWRNAQYGPFSAKPPPPPAPPPYVNPPPSVEVSGYEPKPAPDEAAKTPAAPESFTVSQKGPALGKQVEVQVNDGACDYWQKRTVGQFTADDYAVWILAGITVIRMKHTDRWRPIPEGK